MVQGSREERRNKVIEVLNKARSSELQAVHQYMSQHYDLDDMDYGKLASSLKQIAIDEMRHAEALAERVKELGGEPTSELAGKVQKGQDLETIYSFNAGEEDSAIDSYNQFALVCRENGDSISMKLFEALIDDEQAHFNYFENISKHIKNLGDSYLAQIAGAPADSDDLAETE